MYLQATCLGDSTINASFLMYNEDDNKIVLNETVTTGVSNVYNTTSTYRVVDSGAFNITVNCSSVTDKDNGIENFGIAYGTLTSGVVIPANTSEMIYVNNGTTFLVNLTVNCTGGECGNITAWLDPECPGYDDGEYCWIEDRADQPCDTICANEGSTCDSKDEWNDPTCQVMDQLGISCDTCKGGEQSYYPGYTEDKTIDCYYREVEKLSCSSTERDTTRICGCDLSVLLAWKV